MLRKSGNMVVAKGDSSTPATSRKGGQKQRERRGRGEEGGEGGGGGEGGEPDRQREEGAEG